MLEKHILGHQNRQNRIIVPTVDTGMMKPKNHFLKWFLVVCMVLLLVIFGVLQFLKNKNLIIHSVRIENVHTVDIEKVQKTVDEYLYSFNTFGIPRGNTVLFNKQKLANHLLDQYASFKHVRITFSDPYEILVTVDEYIPTYLWCNDYAQCLFADSTGYVYQYAGEITKGSFPVFYGGMREAEFEIRNNIFSDKKYQDLFDVLDQVTSDYNSHIQSITGINNESVIVHMDRLYGRSLNYNVTMRMNNMIAPEYFASMLDILKRDTGFQNTLQSGNILSYIDLRYPDKIFYKFASSPQMNVSNSDQDKQVKP
jgi:cell division septal protein FtsQ